MGVEILHDKKQGHKCMYCNTTMWAFGGIFEEDEDVVAFMEWLPDDPKTYSDKDLENEIDIWRKSIKSTVAKSPRMHKALKKIFEAVNLADTSMELYKEVESLIKE